MTINAKQRIYRGIPISHGIAMGYMHFCEKKEPVVHSSFSLSTDQVEKEIGKFRSAVDKSKSEILRIKSFYQSRSDEEGILSGHLLMLEDPMITDEVEKRIRILKKNSISIFGQVISEFKKKFEQMEDDYFRERAFDISDVSSRILSHLSPSKGNTVASAKEHSVIVAKRLVPSDVIEADPEKVLAFVTEKGGKNSHAAIIAKARGIPHVSGIDIAHFVNEQTHFLIVDAIKGCVIVNPDTETIEKYKQIIEQEKSLTQRFERERDLDCETIDGYKVNLYGSLDTFEDLEKLKDSSVGGIGLFRTEHLYFQKRRLPTEDEQFEIYSEIATFLAPRPVTIRAFDLEISQLDQYYATEFPPLSCRAMRSLMKREDVLRKQIRAVIRASAYGRLRLMFPMVTDLSELKAAKQIINEETEDIKRKNPSVKPIEVGIMVEVPATVVMCETFAKHVDFFSIGSNDLMQYSLAADRNASNLDEYYSILHPSVLRFFRMIVTSANRHQKPVFLCGELAADPVLISVLLGIGIQHFTVSNRQIPLVKSLVRSINIVDAYQKAEKAFQYEDAKELLAFLKQKD